MSTKYLGVIPTKKGSVLTFCTSTRATLVSYWLNVIGYQGRDGADYRTTRQRTRGLASREQKTASSCSSDRSRPGARLNEPDMKVNQNEAYLIRDSRIGAVHHSKRLRG
jgi:hypothetical protein